MYSKKLAFSNHLTWLRSKVVSGFGLGVVATLIVLTVLLLSNSLKGPAVRPLFQGFDRNSSIVSWPLSFSSSSSGNATVAMEVQSYVEWAQNSQEANASGDFQKEDFVEANGEGMVLEKARLGNFTDMVSNGSFSVEDGKVHQKPLEANGSVVTTNCTLVNSNGDGVVLEETRLGNSSGVAQNGSLLGEDVIEKKTIEGKYEGNATDVSDNVTENNNAGSLSTNGELGISPGGEETTLEENNRGNSTEENEINISNYTAQLMKTHDSFYEECDIFDGRWVRDDSKPYYPAGSCPHVDRDFDCHINGRPDDGYVKWKWKPNGCDIPSLNATDFLERLRGKRLVYVGDSLNRNMWESMVCILRHSIKDKRRVYEISGRKEFKKRGFYAFRFEDYNCSVDYIGAPFLVRESSFNGRNGTIETLRLDLMDQTTSMYHDADVMVFNTGHWWTHEKTSKGEDYYQEGDYVHPRLKVLEAYKRALTTWARWIDKNIDSKRTQIFFRGYSATHFRGGQWKTGGKCHKETEPIFNGTYLAKYPSKMRALEQVLGNMRTPVMYLNISRLTDFRKDGHPSIYRMKYMTKQEMIAAVRFQDCSHWCLPGVPDTWNELLYVSLLKGAWGSWRN